MAGSISPMFAFAHLVPPQQELDNDLSDFTGDRATNYFDSRHTRICSTQSTTRDSQCADFWPSETGSHIPLPGKENILPIHHPTFAVGYPSYIPVSVGPALWPLHTQECLGNMRSFSKGLRNRHEHHPPKCVHRGEPMFSRSTCKHDGYQTGASNSSETEFQRWLCQPLQNAQAAMESTAAAHVRMDQIARWAIEGKQAETAVATHVE